MSLKETIQTDLKKAMRSRDSLKLSVLRMVIAAVFNKEKEKRAKLSKQGQELSKLDEMSKLMDKEVMEVISSEAKKRKDSIEQYQKGTIVGYTVPNIAVYINYPIFSSPLHHGP